MTVAFWGSTSESGAVGTGILKPGQGSEGNSGFVFLHGGSGAGAADSSNEKSTLDQGSSEEPGADAGIEGVKESASNKGSVGV